jgi:uncharacterized membrane protein
VTLLFAIWSLQQQQRNAIREELHPSEVWTHKDLVVRYAQSEITRDEYRQLRRELAEGRYPKLV